jgi:hypothetical protein
MKMTQSTFTETNKISETRFAYEKYCSQASISVYDIFTNNGDLLPRWELIGWTPSKNLAVRRRPEGVAIFVRCRKNEGDYTEGMETWAHFDANVFFTPIPRNQLVA